MANYDDYESAKIEKATKYVMSNKGEYALFKQEDAVPSQMVRLKRVINREGKERWRFYSNLEFLFSLKGEQFTENQKTFMRSVKGFEYLIDKFKTGARETAEFAVPDAELKP
jgi:hypothetical protein